VLTTPVPACFLLDGEDMEPPDAMI
jgi:hypothetical protein